MSTNDAIDGGRIIGSTPKQLHDAHCFVVMPFGRDTEEQRWFQGWYRTVIEPVITAAGYTAVLAAAEDQPGAINDEIRAHLAFDPMVVVDLGGRTPDDPPNPNVMYELGIRHAFGLPLVIMAWEGQRLPFDVSNQRAITTRRDFLDIEPTRAKLTRFIQAAREGRYYNPMESVGREAAIEAASLALGEDSLLAALANEVRELRTSFNARNQDAATRRWKRASKVKGALSKVDRAGLWRFASQNGFDSRSWSKFLGISVMPNLLEEMKGWSMDQWQQFVVQQLPNFSGVAPTASETQIERGLDEGRREQQEFEAFEQHLAMAVTILPKQPWPTGVHRELASKMDISTNRASALIQELIKRGTFLNQVDGKLLVAAAEEVIRGTE